MNQYLLRVKLRGLFWIFSFTLAYLGNFGIAQAYTKIHSFIESQDMNQIYGKIVMEDGQLLIGSNEWISLVQQSPDLIKQNAEMLEKFVGQYDAPCEYLSETVLKLANAYQDVGIQGLTCSTLNKGRIDLGNRIHDHEMSSQLEFQFSRTKKKWPNSFSIWMIRKEDWALEVSRLIFDLGTKITQGKNRFQARVIPDHRRFLPYNVHFDWKLRSR